MLEIILVVLCVLLAWKTPSFLSSGNLLNVLRNVSMQGIIAFAMTMVIICGEIDLSVGSLVAFGGCLCAWMISLLTGPKHMDPVLAVTLSILLTASIGAVVGIITGFLRMRFRVPTFISTLAWMGGLKGAAELITNGFPIQIEVPWFSFIGSGYLYGIPFPAIIFLVVFVLIHLLMNFTTFGRSVYAVGGNMEAARLSGIKVMQIKIGVMATVAILAAISGVMVASQISSGSALSGTGWELDVIAAVVIGGCSMTGGSGRIWGTMVGVIFLGVLVNGMTLLNISEYWQHVVRGVLILIAVLINVGQGAKGGKEA
jgi:ribose/xylose/arabinose/galactoside ABC-type transport system permease subunit